MCAPPMDSTIGLRKGAAPAQKRCTASRGQLLARQALLVGSDPVFGNFLLGLIESDVTRAHVSVEKVFRLVFNVSIPVRALIWLRPQVGLFVRSPKLQRDQVIDFAPLLRIAIARVISGQTIALIDGILLGLGNIPNALAIAGGADEIDSYRIIDLHIRACLVGQTACYLIVRDRSENCPRSLGGVQAGRQQAPGMR